MSTRGRLLTVASAAGAALLLALSSSAFAALSDDERKCSDAVNKGGRNVGNQEQKNNRSCVKNGSGDISACVNAEGAKAAEKRVKLQDTFATGAKCDPVPPFGVNSDPDDIADGIENGTDDIIRAILGVPPDGVVAGDKCQDAMAKRAGKKYDTELKAFRGCAKDLPAINSIDDLEGCVTTAVNDAKAEGVEDKLEADITGKCLPLPHAGTEDGACASKATAEDLANCIGDRVSCDACLAINNMTGGNANCDLLDDGSVNGSCYPLHDLGDHKCTLTAPSSLTLYTQLGALGGPTTGAVDISCDQPDLATGKASCKCGVQAFAPINVFGIFVACVGAPTGSCVTGGPALDEIDCDGGNALDLSSTGNRAMNNPGLNCNLTPGHPACCTSNADCEAKCATLCGGAGNVFEGACEGFCTLGTESACTSDAQCLAISEGSCNGPDGVGFGNICDCTCITQGGAASPPGGLACQLAFDLTVEPADADPCDGSDVTINVGTACAPLTTGSSTGVTLNAQNIGGTLGPVSGAGGAIPCGTIGNSTLTGLEMVGQRTFYASTIGDILVDIDLFCQ